MDYGASKAGTYTGIELLSTWLQPGPYGSLSPAFETAVWLDAGCCARVGLEWVREHPGNCSCNSYSFPSLCYSLLNIQVVGTLDTFVS